MSSSPASDPLSKTQRAGEGGGGGGGFEALVSDLAGGASPDLTIDSGTASAAPAGSAGSSLLLRTMTGTGSPFGTSVGSAGATFGGGNSPDEEMAPFDQLVVAYESASNRLPANLSTRFHESIAAGSAQLSLLVEQWVATEGPGATGGGGGGNGGASCSSSPSAAARARRNSLIAGSSPASQRQQQQPNSPAAGSAVQATRRNRGSSVTMQAALPPHAGGGHQGGGDGGDADDELVDGGIDLEASSADGGGGNSPGASGSAALALRRGSNSSSASAVSSKAAAGPPMVMSGGGPVVQRRSGGGSVGMSTAAKARLRHTLEQGLTDYVNHIQSAVLAEIETVNIASAQVVARGGVLAQQYKSAMQELAAARREINRMEAVVKEQAGRMDVLEGDGTKREDQFDFLRQQLVAREDMLRESTATFRKELSRYKSRVADLEADLERKKATSVSVVGGWGYRLAPNHHGADMGNGSMGMTASTMRGGSQHAAAAGRAASVSGGLGATTSTAPAGASPPANSGGGNRISNDPDPRGVLQAATAMDALGGGGASNASPDPNRAAFNDFSFASPSSGLVQPEDASSASATAGAIAASPSPGMLGSRALSPVPAYSVSHLIQVASDAGVGEALREQQRDFERRIFAVKQRMMEDKKKSMSELRAKQDAAIRILKREVEQLKAKVGG